jgi:hypothetical protein
LVHELFLSVKVSDNGDDLANLGLLSGLFEGVAEGGGWTFSATVQLGNR